MKERFNIRTGNVVVEVEHVDGNCLNNSEDNLIALCPNCHAMTPTYRALNTGHSGRNRNPHPRKTIENIKKLCLNCGLEMSRNNKTGKCKKCKSKHSKHSLRRNRGGTCIDCGFSIDRSNKRCIKCQHLNMSKHIPSEAVLKSQLIEFPVSELGEMYGVSGSAVIKWCKKYNIKTQPRGYWSKLKAGKL